MIRQTGSLGGNLPIFTSISVNKRRLDPIGAQAGDLFAACTQLKARFGA